MLMFSMLWYVDFYELFVLWVGSSGGCLPPAPNPLLCGEGVEGNNYAFRGRGRGLGSFWGKVVRKYLEILGCNCV